MPDWTVAFHRNRNCQKIDKNESIMPEDIYQCFTFCMYTCCSLFSVWFPSEILSKQKFSRCTFPKIPN